MNQHNMQQFYEQQNSLNGYSGNSFQATQQTVPSSYNGSTPTSNQYRQQNGIPRFSHNENESFDLQSPQNTPSQSGSFPNFIDPHMGGGYDPRNRPNYEQANGIMPSMDGFGANMYSGKARMNDMAAMFNNPVGIATLQRQRMTMFPQNRENDFMSPTNPFAGGFNPQQMAQMLHQQRFTAALQRQAHEQQVASQQMSRQYIGPDQGIAKNEMNQTVQNSNRNTSVAGNSNEAVQRNNSQSNLQNTDRLTAPTSKLSSASSGNSTPRPPYDPGSEAHRNAAILAAAAVRAEAAASTRARTSGFPGSNMGSFPYGLRGFSGHNDQMPSPYQGQPSPDFSGVMSPNKDFSGMNPSPLNQGRGTPRNGIPPPPYSPMPNSNDSNHSGSGSVKDSQSNLAAPVKPNIPGKLNENILSTNTGSDFSGSNILVAGSATRLSAPPTPGSLGHQSPTSSPFHDHSDITSGMSPSWPQTPASPDTCNKLKACASPRHFDQLSKVYDLIVDEEKRNFLDRYLAFMSINGTPITKVPVLNKEPVDLYMLFRSVCERGGIMAVKEKKQFKEILKCLKLPTDNVLLAYAVKEQYMTYLHAYEIKAKDALLKQWKEPITLIPKVEDVVPTISLNDSFHPTINDMKSPVSESVPASNMNGPTTSWNPALINQTSNTSTLNQFIPRMSYPSQTSNPTMPSYGHPGFGSGPEVPPGYPGTVPFGVYPNQMYARGPLPGYNTMRPGLPTDSMQAAWSRGYSPRQGPGPPELFPEGLQHLPWNQQARHPGSLFASPNFSGGKPRNQMPPISREQLEQMKYHQQLKMQQYQQQQMQQRFTSIPTKGLPKTPRQNMTPDIKGVNPSSSKTRDSFTNDGIEGTKPQLRKRKKLTSKDLGPVEAWRIMMSLKSGLVAECTWAIDTLNILLSDNKTITYFHLNQLPGLLDTLMDHYRRFLSLMFKNFHGEEIPLVPNQESNETKESLNILWIGVCKNAKESYSANIASNAVMSNIHERLPCGKEVWKRGGGDSTSHIQPSFPTKDIPLRTYPKGIPYESEADIEKKRRLERVSSPRKIEGTRELSTEQVNSACLDDLSDLINSCEEEPVEKQKNPMVEKLITELEFNMPCGKKYLEDSREFIGYLNRRLQRENRGRVKNEQCVVKQPSPFMDLPESERLLLHRCVAMSNIFRSLSFIQGNDSELAGNIGLLLIASHVLLHKHVHNVTDHSKFKMGLDKRDLNSSVVVSNENEVWCDALRSMRENTLVLLSNISGHLNLSQVSDEVQRPLIDGLLHWLTCKSSEALDPLPTAPGPHALSPQRLAIETLAKMTINSNNIEFVTRSPDEALLERIADCLIEQVSRKHYVAVREFSLILLDNLSRFELFCKILATRHSCVSNIVKFISDAEKNTSIYLSSGGRVQPGLNAEDICGTSISLLRRSVNILLSLAKIPCNRTRLMPYTDDLLALSTSQMIDTSVLALLSQVLFELSD